MMPKVEIGYEWVTHEKETGDTNVTDLFFGKSKVGSIYKRDYADRQLNLFEPYERPYWEVCFVHWDKTKWCNILDVVEFVETEYTSLEEAKEGLFDFIVN